MELFQMRQSGMQYLARKMPSFNTDARVSPQGILPVLERPYGGLNTTIKSEPVTPFPKPQPPKTPKR